MTETDIRYVPKYSDWAVIAEELEYPTRILPMPSTQICDLVNGNPEQLLNAQSEFIKMLLRSFIHQSFEAISAYCEQTNQYETFQNRDWYRFAKVTRNCLVHDGIVRYGGKDRQLLPIAWKGLEYTAEMEGDSLDTSFFGIDTAISLHRAMSNFVGNWL